MNENTFSILKKIYREIPVIRPLMAFIYQRFIAVPKFSGWGMTSVNELPWIDKYDWDTFRQASADIKINFNFTPTSVGIDSTTIDSLLWRHWIVAFTVRYAAKFYRSDSHGLALVELGVADGLTAYFALRELESYKKYDLNFHYTMYLYDSWGPMRDEQLLETELSHTINYSGLSLERTKKNLFEFKDTVVYHQGYIPESLSSTPIPDSIIYMHIDLNSALATSEALKLLYSRMVEGGVILFDDYGSPFYKETKEAVDHFFSDKPGILLKLPTGQSIYFFHS